VSLLLKQTPFDCGLRIYAVSKFLVVRIVFLGRHGWLEAVVAGELVAAVLHTSNKKAIHERGICYRNLCESLPSFGTLRKCELLHSLKHCSTLFRESAFAILPQHV
jgi:hypothetical protein